MGDDDPVAVSNLQQVKLFCVVEVENPAWNGEIPRPRAKKPVGQKREPDDVLEVMTWQFSLLWAILAKVATEVLIFVQNNLTVAGTRPVSR